MDASTFFEKARFLVSAPWVAAFWALVFVGVIFKIKMPTRGRHFFQRLRVRGARLVRRLLVLVVIVIEEGEIVVIVFDLAAVFERLAGAPLHNHAHQNSEITRPASTRMPTPANDSKKKWYSDSMLMTIFLSFR